MQFFLLGFMGCGKSFWGKQLALRYHWPHIDLDDYIEEKEHTTIRQLFETKGEPFFRVLESKYLHDLIEAQSHLIVSTGGGTPCIQQNIDLMNRSGTTIYLQASVDFLYANLTNNPGSRPLLNSSSGDALKAQIESKLKDRQTYYQQAHYTVEVERADEFIFDNIFKSYV